MKIGYRWNISFIRVFDLNNLRKSQITIAPQVNHYNFRFVYFICFNELFCISENFLFKTHSSVMISKQQLNFQILDTKSRLFRTTPFPFCIFFIPNIPHTRSLLNFHNQQFSFYFLRNHSGNKLTRLYCSHTSSCRPWSRSLFKQ